MSYSELYAKLLLLRQTVINKNIEEARKINLEFNTTYDRIFHPPYEEGSAANLYDRARNAYLNALGIGKVEFEEFVQDGDKLLEEIKQRGYNK